MLERLEITSRDERIESLKTRLEQQVSDEELPVVLETTADLVVDERAKVQREKQEIEKPIFPRVTAVGNSSSCCRLRRSIPQRWSPRSCAPPLKVATSTFVTRMSPSPFPAALPNVPLTIPRKPCLNAPTPQCVALSVTAEIYVSKKKKDCLDTPKCEHCEYDQ